MSKSALYAANTSAQNIAVNGNINPGTVIRRYGPNVNLSGSAIQISGAGYYEIDASFTAAPTTVGNVTITAFLNNVAIPGGTATESVSTANDSANLAINCIVRQPCECCEGISNLTFVLTGTASSVTNTAIVVEKL